MPDSVLVVLVLLIVVPLTTVRAVPRRHCAVIERLGRFHRIAGHGLTALVPFVDRIRARVDLREQVVTLPARPLGTSDGTVTVGMVVRFRVTDPRAAVYEVPGHHDAVVRLAVTTLEQLLARLSREDAVESPEQLGRHLRAELGMGAQRWGIEVDAVELEPVTEVPATQDPATEVSDTTDTTGAVPGEA